MSTSLVTPTRSLSLSQSYSPSSLPSSSSSRNNPLSLRIYKAIGTTFEDPGSREALDLAASLYASGPLKGKERAPNGDSDLDHGDLDIATGLGGSRRAANGESAAMARKYLKRDVENWMAEGSQQFLDAFGEVDKVS